jgi:hypothetical protein
MQTDRTAKFLLGAIALALWVNIARGVFTPAPAIAEAVRAPIRVDIVGLGGSSVSGHGLPTVVNQPLKVQVVK